MAPNFLLLTVGLALFVDLLCYSIIMPLTPFLIEQMGLGPSANGVLVACYAAGLLIASFGVGYVSDKIASRRTPMMIGLLALMLATVLFMEAMDHYWVLIVARLAAGLAGGTVMTLGFALLSDTFPANQLGEQMGKALIGQTLGLMLGPPVGGALDEGIGAKAPFVFCIIFIVIDLVARVLIIEPRTAKIKQIRAFQKQQKQDNGTTPVDKSTDDSLELATAATLTMTATTATEAGDKLQGKQEKTTLLKLMRHPRLFTALMVSFVQAFVVSAIEPVLPLYLEREFDATKTRVGLIFLALSIPTIAAPLAGAFSDRHGARWMVIFFITICAAVSVVMGIPNLPLWAIIVCLIVLGGCSASYLTPVLGEISAVVRVTGDGDGFARAFGLFNAVFSLGMVAGPLLGALVYERTNMFWTMVMIGAVTLLPIPLVVMFMANKKQKLLDQEEYESTINEQDRILAHIHETKVVQEKVEDVKVEK
ncbi:hypothetical protein DFQ27_006920 [Actinomortierella ambigua]|uniref:Major facilitator superfamily (MFS) profile domain-containing protein n=1 Tax=Actinomortierella ambigua TaxID=1343610 RepID=A0A9P6PWS0_9FUNG|nr:hypothetical protein DFQ27_006920 [Actinomortierella ambigua]